LAHHIKINKEKNFETKKTHKGFTPCVFGMC
jgi:hypothetical protein